MAGSVPQFSVGERDDLVDVRLLGVPVAVHQAVVEHVDELRREFALLRVSHDDPVTTDVPAQLLELVEDLERRFSQFTGPTNAELEEAMERGDDTVDVVYRVPPSLGSGAEALDAALDAADDYCRRGEELLTLASPPEGAAYRRWLLAEFTRQLTGEPPRPWPAR